MPTHLCHPDQTSNRGNVDLRKAFEHVSCIEAHATYNMALLFLDHGREERFERPEVTKRIDFESPAFTR